jgi:hypothetical protein
MIVAGTVKSGGGRSGRLQAFAFWPINAKPAGVASTSRFQWFKPRANLDMPNAKIAPKRRARKWYTAQFPKISISINANSGERMRSPQLGRAR